MQFLLICRDGADALPTRLANRTPHLSRIVELWHEGHILDGGAILDDDGEMAGSAVFCDFPDREALDAYLAEEIYAKVGVWQDIEIIPIRRVMWPSERNPKAQ